MFNYLKHLQFLQTSQSPSNVNYILQQLSEYLLVDSDLSWDTKTSKISWNSRKFRTNRENKELTFKVKAAYQFYLHLARKYHFSLPEELLSKVVSSQ